jgi:acyl-coenzyme A synthetase/AMP-(fatty) acid ligase/3-hydroxymyristoyl/3-hydroxydecanoyl-(acyl carrier protein) dehydratase
MRDTPIIPLSDITEDSRAPDAVVCYEKTYAAGKRLTWQDFLRHTALLRAALRERGEAEWLLHSEDCWYFLTGLTALLQCGKRVMLTAHLSAGYVAGIRGPETGLLTDRGDAAESLHIPSLVHDDAASGAARDGAMPRIDAAATEIALHTSGTTGEPKVVRHRLRELENDNRFILSKWGEELGRRKACATVSPHHIYGLLFAALLPFSAGIPFRRTRIAYPEELEACTDDSYLIVTVPAFLKRAVEGRTAPFPLKSPWIFTSGGVLEPETAARTEKIFGFWPREVYGSTETSGIATRVSKEGLAWTPFAGAEISLDDEGRLTVRSPYIRDPAGFVTGDRAEILSDRRFLLKERTDLIVKIEEQRVSLTEVEQRIMKSGLVREAAVAPLESRRQFLGAALVLNDAGIARFSGCARREIRRYFTAYLAGFFEKAALPRKWRCLTRLPLTPQGKVSRAEIAALFSSPAPPFSGLGIERVLEQTANAASVEVAVPETSGYFEGHFPGFKLLPGVAHVDIALRFASRYLGAGLFVSRIKRLRFSRRITPDAVIRLDLTMRADTLAFTLTSPDRTVVYSTGHLTLEARR